MLVLLPTSTNKLLAQWQGPYQVVSRMGKLHYLLDMHDRRKHQRVFHSVKEWERGGHGNFMSPQQP